MWLNDELLKVVYPNLYVAESGKGFAVADKIAGTNRLGNSIWHGTNLLFWNVIANELLDLILKLQNVTLNNSIDKWQWEADVYSRWLQLKDCYTLMIRFQSKMY